MQAEKGCTFKACILLGFFKDAYRFQKHALFLQWGDNDMRVVYFLIRYMQKLLRTV